jgi:peptidoglycan hydrolase-like protein with peptidoglycan-binding domain
MRTHFFVCVFVAISLVLPVGPASSSDDLNRALRMGIGVLDTLQQLQQRSEPAQRTQPRQPQAQQRSRVISRSVEPSAAQSRERVRNVQASLNRLGFDAGPEDGLAGVRTRAAVEAFRSRHGFGSGGDIDDALVGALQFVMSQQARQGPPQEPGKTTEAAPAGAEPAVSAVKPQDAPAAVVSSSPSTGPQAPVIGGHAGMTPSVSSGGARGMPQNDAELVDRCQLELFDAFVVPEEYRTPSAPLDSFLRVAMAECPDGNSILSVTGSLKSRSQDGLLSPVQMLRSELACPSCEARILYYCGGDEVGPRIAYREERVAITHAWEWPGPEARRAGEEVPVHQVRYAPYGELLRFAIEGMGQEAVSLPLQDFRHAFRQGQIDCVAGVSTAMVPSVRNVSVASSPSAGVGEPAVVSTAPVLPAEAVASPDENVLPVNSDGSSSTGTAPPADPRPLTREANTSAPAASQVSETTTLQAAGSAETTPAVPSATEAAGTSAFGRASSMNVPFSPEDLEMIARCKNYAIELEGIPAAQVDDEWRWRGYLITSTRWCDERLHEIVEHDARFMRRGVRLLLVEPLCETCLLNAEFYCKNTVEDIGGVDGLQIVYREPSKEFPTYAWLIRPLIERLGAEPEPHRPAEAFSAFERGSAACIAYVNIGDAPAQ